MTSASFHQRHRLLLANLTCDEVLGSAVDRLAEQRGVNIPPSWCRIWGRIEDPTTGRARMLLQAEGDPTSLCTLEVGVGEGVLDPVLGRIRLTSFPEDPSLDSLPYVLAKYSGAQIVRYRPGKRCTLRIAAPTSRPASGSDGPVYAKVFADGRASRLNAEGHQLWDAARSGTLDVAVAEPIGLDRATRTYVQSEVPGVPILGHLQGLGGLELAHRLGAAAASIPGSALLPHSILEPSSELARTRRRAAEIEAFVPSLGEPLRALVANLEQLHDRFDVRAPRPIHGSPHTSQWLLSEHGLGLVDFDRLSLGDPELDVATFSAEIDFEQIDHRRAIVDAFEAGYEERFGPLDQERLAVYRAHKRLAKVHRTARAIRIDGDERAAAFLRTAHAAISSLALT